MRDHERVHGNRRRNIWRSPAAVAAVVVAVITAGTLGVVLARGGSPAAGPADVAPGHRTFPTRDTSGVPENWRPAQSVRGDYRVDRANAVIEDLRITDGSLLVEAPNVTVRRVEILGGGINNFPGTSCNNGLVIEDTTIKRSSADTTDDQLPAVAYGGYTARRVLIDGLPEGFRVGGRGDGCSSVTIEDSFASVRSPDICTDWHGDALQGYDGARLQVRNTWLEIVETTGCAGTAAFFYPPGQGNVDVDIDGLRVSGGGYPFRLGTPGVIRDLEIVDESWHFRPIDVACSLVSAWDASIITLQADGRSIPVRLQACDSEWD
ncbi:hypothetical protein [Georgenia yuyongxinii]|uniref:Glycosyl hydrolase family 28 n=1 Tax=Georgenia yuyongxinii TaxID=2589797 RepID=A0A552WLC1_9MICO|nr:hypothetical protein [Georgenia yuyongxinii]TRW43568.1 hypothetical protein FJ693_17085 [Georgenia yuyongxinii]